MRKPNDYMPAGHLGTCRMGELAEVAFMYRAASHGIAVAKPYGNSLPYDFLVQHGRRLLRVQVKSCFSPQRRGYNGFPIVVACHWGRGKLAYSPDQIDLIAAFIAKHDAWYLIPVESLKNRKNIRLYPASKKPLRRGGQYESYREAWHLLKDENDTGANYQERSIEKPRLKKRLKEELEKGWEGEWEGEWEGGWKREANDGRTTLSSSAEVRDKNRAYTAADAEADAP